MSKTIRFTELVKRSGKPQTVALWTKPKDNPSFMKAVHDNRVLTVIQKPTGNQKDFGLIGLVQEQFALFMVFPKPLPKASEARVLGINYELVDEAAAGHPNSKEKLRAQTRPPISRPPPVPKAKPKQKLFRVTIVRTATEEVVLSVRGQNLHEAEAAGLQTVKKKKFQPQETRDAIKTLAEIV